MWFFSSLLLLLAAASPLMAAGPDADADADFEPVWFPDKLWDEPDSFNNCSMGKELWEQGFPVGEIAFWSCLAYSNSRLYIQVRHSFGILVDGIKIKILDCK